MYFPKRKEIRLKEYDYSANGAYFVTVCTKDRKNILSTIRVGGAHTPSANVSPHSGRRPCRRTLDAPIVKLTEIGKSIENNIIKMNVLYENIKVKDYVIMPNHIHLIITVKENGRSGAPAPTRANARIPRYVSTLKRFVNKECKCDIWQRSYYDHIIRNEADYMEKQKYILANPGKWVEDEYYSQ